MTNNYGESMSENLSPKLEFFTFKCLLTVREKLSIYHSKWFTISIYMCSQMHSISSGFKNVFSVFLRLLISSQRVISLLIVRKKEIGGFSVYISIESHLSLKPFLHGILIYSLLPLELLWDLLYVNF